MGKILRSQPYRLLAVLLACLLCVSCVQPAFAANETAKTVQLMKTEGTVSVSNSSGKKVSLRDNMRLYNGYHVGTEDASYAWFNLDSAKLSKLDEVSEMELRKSGKKLELLLNSGDLFFNVTEPLASDETLNIHTSTMVAGIRGTCGWVRVIDQWRSRLYVLEGRVECTVTDPVTGQTKTTVLTGGEWAEFVVYDQSRAGDKCDIIRQRFSEGNIPGFVLVELVGDSALCEKIYADSGLDLRNMTASQAADRLRDDQAVTAQKISSIRKEQAEQDRNVSADPVWRDETPGGTAPSTTPSGGGTGSSGGNNTPNRPDRPSSGITDTTPTITQAVVMTMPVTIPQIQAALDPDSVTSVTVNPGAGDNTLVQNPGETLHVASGKTLTLANGVDLTENGTLNVDGTMTVNGNLINNGVITVTSPNSLHVNGRFVNNVSGQVRNIQNGHIVPAKGIENSGSISTTGSANLESAAEATVTMLDERASLTLNGGSISNTAAGSALRWENGKLPAADITGNDTTNIWTAGGAPLSAVVNGVEQTDIIPEGYKLVTNAGQTSLRPTGGVEGGVLVDPVTVSFDANGGRWSGTAPSITVERGETMGAQSAAPSREGYTFVDWRDAEGTLYTESSVITGSITLYAQWRASGGSEVPGEDEITVTFASEGVAVASIRIRRGGSLPYLPAAPERKGYVFQGWSGVQDTYAADTTLTALWQSESGAEPPEMVTVTFVSAGTVVLETEVEKGGSLDYLPAPPLRSGYIFNGWSGALDAYDADTTVTALWRTESTYVPPSPPETVTVTFVSEEENVAVIELEKGDPLPYLPAVTRSGYIFSGWDGLQETYTADTTLTAVWVEEGGTVTVTFEPNLPAEVKPENDFGYSYDTPGTLTIEAGDTLRYPLFWPVPLNYDYEFLGWSMTKLGIVTDLEHFDQNQLADDFATWNDPVTSDLTFYGVWAARPGEEPPPPDVMPVSYANANPAKVQAALNLYKEVTIYADENGSTFSRSDDLLIPDGVTLHLAAAGEEVATEDGQIITENAAWLELSGKLTVLGALDIPGSASDTNYSLRSSGSRIMVGYSPATDPVSLLSNASDAKGIITCGGILAMRYGELVNTGEIYAYQILMGNECTLTNSDYIYGGLMMYTPPSQEQSLGDGPLVNLLPGSEVSSVYIEAGTLYVNGAYIRALEQNGGEVWLTDEVGGLTHVSPDTVVLLNGGDLHLNAKLSDWYGSSPIAITVSETKDTPNLYMGSNGSFDWLNVREGAQLNIWGSAATGSENETVNIETVYLYGELNLNGCNIQKIQQYNNAILKMNGGHVSNIEIRRWSEDDSAPQFEQAGGSIDSLYLEKGTAILRYGASVATAEVTEDGRLAVDGGTIDTLKVNGIPLESSDIPEGDILVNAYIASGLIGVFEQTGGLVTIAGGTITDGCSVTNGGLWIDGGMIFAIGTAPAITMSSNAIVIVNGGMIEADSSDAAIQHDGGRLSLERGQIISDDYAVISSVPPETDAKRSISARTGGCRFDVGGGYESVGDNDSEWMPHILGYNSSDSITCINLAGIELPSDSSFYDLVNASVWTIMPIPN